MSEESPIDVEFDMRSDSNGRDPDHYSPTLREYHRRLWSKELPNGEMFDLHDMGPRGYLKHSSDLGTFLISSDTIVHTFTNHLGMRHIIEQIPTAELDDYLRRGYTIGGMIVFPGNKIDNKQTINQARGTHPRIQDRIDLTLECIRLHYAGETSPLSKVLARYSDFFALFGDFRGYVEYFLLDDLVTDDYSSVRFFLPFQGFTAANALPADLDAYLEFRKNMFGWIAARNTRIAATGL